jgi:predicted PurR-regulated permease PerM
MALALLLSFALGPPVLLLRRWHVNRVLSVIAAVVLAFSVILGIGALIGSQLAHLAGNLPGYQTNITEKIHSLRDTTTSSGVVRRAATMLSDLGNEITKPREKVGRPAANGPVALAPGDRQQKPVPVEIRPSDPTPVQLILEVAGPLLRPLATAGIVLVFVIFFLLQRQDLRDRFIRLAGARRHHYRAEARHSRAARYARERDSKRMYRFCSFTRAYCPKTCTNCARTIKLYGPDQGASHAERGGEDQVPSLDKGTTRG